MSAFIYTSKNKDLLFDDFINKYSDKLRQSDDFIPWEYQVKLLMKLENSGGIVFLPVEHDKLYFGTIIIKRATKEIIKSKNKRIFYITSSDRNIEKVATFIRRHCHLNVVSVHNISDNNDWTTLLENMSIVVISSSCYLSALINMYTKPSDAYLLLFDDCAYCYENHPIRQIMNVLQNISFWPNIIALTSFLIHYNIQFDQIYDYLKQMEVIFNSTIVASQHCNVTLKYLIDSKIKYIKFQKILQLDENLKKSANAIFIGTAELITYSKDLSDVLIRDLEKILSRISYVLECYGAFPAYIIASYYQVKLERMKSLLVSPSFNPFFVILSDLNVYKCLICKHLQKYGPLNDSTTIIMGCTNKIVKLVSFLYKINPKDTCIIFTENYFEAVTLSYILQELSSTEVKMSHMLVEFLGDDDLLLGLITEREKCFRQKNMKIILKKYKLRLLNVLVIPWTYHFKFSDNIDANYLIYFHDPPDLMSYVNSIKFSTCDNPIKLFFTQEYVNTKGLCEYDLKSIEKYVDVDLALKEILQKKDVNYEEEQIIKNYLKYQKDENKSDQTCSPLKINEYIFANLSNSIGIVNRYCENLPKDAVCNSAPYYRVLKKDGCYIGQLQLPIQSGIKESFEIISKNDLQNIKKMTALEAVKLLYKLGHLDNNLMPVCRRSGNIIRQNEIINDDKKTTKNINEENINTEKDKSKHKVTSCSIIPLKFADWIYESCPQADVECYLHVIRLNPAYQIPTEERKLFFHRLIESDDEFGFLTHKKLPKILQFPVYSDLGQINVNIDVNYSVLKLTQEQINRAIHCHRFIFLDVLEVVKRFLVCDYSNTENSYCIVPITKDESGLVIAWDVLYNHCVKHEIVEPPEHERISNDYYKENYLGKVVTPWYRPIQSAIQYYIVTKVPFGVTPNSPLNLPDQIFKTMSYADYYFEKYNLEVKQLSQPLLDAKAITNNLNCLRPRAQRPGVRRRRGERENELPETLIPEFCILQPFPAVYWYKAITLPTITHRLHFALIANSLREHMALKTMPDNWSLPDIQKDDVLVADDDCIQEMEELSKAVVPISMILRDIKMAKRKRRYLWADEQLPMDDEHNLNKISLLELMVYDNFIRSNSEYVNCASVYTLNTNIPVDYEKSHLNFLNLSTDIWTGVKQSDLIQAFTATHCQDIINLERFKNVGTSFIRFATSLWLYKLYDDLNVSQLFALRKNLTNKNGLLKCGNKLDLGSYLKLQDFSAKNDWYLDGFCIPEVLTNVWNLLQLPAELVFNLEIPRTEQIASTVSAETRNHMHNKMLDYFNESEEHEKHFPSHNIFLNENNNHALIYFKKQCVPDKAIANAFKAVMGVVVADCGVETSLKLLQYVNLLDDKIMVQDMLNDLVTLHEKDENGILEYSALTTILGYEFKCKRLVDEAFTHYSYFPVSYKQCNQKLAFLGDAILDFLISGFIYEQCAALKISETEDLHVALVNDVLYAILSVKLGLHKFLHIESISIMKQIDQFIREQEKVNNIIDHYELLFLVEETNDITYDLFDVPKVLVDIFKSIAGAIFLDSGGNLKIVWNVFYNIMKTEIEKFFVNVPKNAIRLLSETDLIIEYEYYSVADDITFKKKISDYMMESLTEEDLSIVYEKPTPFNKDPNIVIVKMNVVIEHIDQKIQKSYFGVGRNKKQAKLIATKIALKRMCKEFTL